MSQQSYNFQIAKCGALFAVMIGHYAQAINHPWKIFLWIPAQIGLAVFAFSSGYFTAGKHQEGFSIKAFWQSKVVRLLGPILVANCFVVSLLLARGDERVFQWSSLFSMVGLNGILLWADTQRHSPLGNGLWFFTLLMAFYATYPLIRRAFRDRTIGGVVCVVGLAGALAMSRWLPVGVALWETAWFFLFGSFAGTHCQRFRLVPACILLVGCGIAIPLCKFKLGVESMTGPLVLATGVGTVTVLTSAPLGRFGTPLVTLVASVMFEMYVIHTYLFQYGVTPWTSTDLGVSIILVFIMAQILRPAGRRLGVVLHEGIERFG